MSDSYDLRSALADDDARSHSIAGSHSRHDRPISNAKIVNSIDLEVVVYYRHRIVAHLGGARLVVVGSGRVADEIVKCGAFQVTWPPIPDNISAGPYKGKYRTETRIAVFHSGLANRVWTRRRHP